MWALCVAVPCALSPALLVGRTQTTREGWESNAREDTEDLQQSQRSTPRWWWLSCGAAPLCRLSEASSPFSDASPSFPPRTHLYAPVLLPLADVAGMDSGEGVMVGL